MVFDCFARLPGSQTRNTGFDFLENKADGGNTRHRFSFLMSRGSRNEDVRLIDRILLLRVNGYGRVR